VPGLATGPVLRSTDRKAAGSVFLILLGLFTATFSGLPDNPDAEVEFQTTSSIARAGRLALGGTPEADAIVASKPAGRGGRSGFNVVEGGPGREGRHYSWFGVGQALVGVPFYFAGSALEAAFPSIEEAHRGTTHYGVGRSEYFQHLVVGWRNPLLSALTACLIVLAALRLGMPRLSAWLAGMAYGLSTFAWPQARSTLSDVQATFFLFFAFYLLISHRRENDWHPAVRPWRLGLAGLALGMAFLTRVVTAPVIAVLLFAAVVMLRKIAIKRGGSAWRQQWQRSLQWVAVPALGCVAAFCVFNSLRFGSPFETGYGEAVFAGGFFSYPFHLGLLGLAIAPGKGLLWMAPLICVLPFGIRALAARRQTLTCWVLLGVTVATIAPVAPTQTWDGAWTYGPRYLLPLLPFLWLGVAAAIEAIAGRTGPRVLAVLLGLLGLATTLPGVLVDHVTHEDMAVQTARLVWEEADAETEVEKDAVRFLRIQWSPGFAAPWAHWRILRHRLAGLGDEMSVREIFLVDRDETVTPAHDRERGFRHFAWVDLVERLGGSAWPALILCALVGIGGVFLALTALDPRRV